jgi:hypothetical protein
MRGSIVIKTFLVLLAFLFIGSLMVIATPTGPGDPSLVSTDRKTEDPAQLILAYAGNISEIDLFGYALTQNWQGYYGNVTGKIVLADANNNSMYIWEVAEPTGEVYAARANSINWTRGNVNCSQAIDIVYEDETFLTINNTYEDSVNKTFNSTSHPYVEVGTGGIIENTCYSTNMYDSNQAFDPDHFHELMLYDSSSSEPIYVAIMENSEAGFNAEQHDFEMIVPEPGTTDDAVTNYYFYIEIGAS